MVLGRELGEKLTELRCLASSLYLNLSGDGGELVDVSRSHLLLDSEKSEIEFVLVSLLEEGNEECAGLEDLRAENGVEESPVVQLSLGQLPRGEFFLTFD